LTTPDLIALSPLIVLACATIVIMLVIAARRNHALTMVLTLLADAGAFASLFVVSRGVSRQVAALLIMDDYSLFYMALIFAASLVVTLLAYSYLERRREQCEEFYLVLLLATLGSAVLVASTHFVSFFLGLEILSVSLYVLIAYQRSSELSIEAGIKYLILAAASSAFLLFGMALTYADLGTMDVARMSLLMSGKAPSTLLLSGLAMIIVGVGFKLAVVPFHMWTPDVYEGAPAPVTAFIATVSKGGMFALLMRYFSGLGLHDFGSLSLLFAIIAIASMLAGNVLALLQTNVKRILAYSSIAHLGYLLVAFLASGSIGTAAVTYYLVAYFVTMLGALGVISVLSVEKREADAMIDYQGLFWQRPWLATVFAASLLSLAGIPLTAGFIGKFYIIAAAIGSTLWWLVFILVVSSGIGLFYYLRIIVAMYKDPPRGVQVTVPSLSLTDTVALATLTLLLVWLGVYPAPLIHTVQWSVASLSKY
jgi:NADH-quinone oxidoreductase subunit N